MRSHFCQKIIVWINTHLAHALENLLVLHCRPEPLVDDVASQYVRRLTERRSRQRRPSLDVQLKVHQFMRNGPFALTAQSGIHLNSSNAAIVLIHSSIV